MFNTSSQWARAQEDVKRLAKGDTSVEQQLVFLLRAYARHANHLLRRAAFDRAKKGAEGGSAQHFMGVDDTAISFDTPEDAALYGKLADAGMRALSYTDILEGRILDVVRLFHEEVRGAA